MKEEIMLYETYSDEDDVEAVKKVTKRNTWWCKGEEVDEFENKIADYVGTGYAVTFNSGTSALFANLLLNDIENKEVIIPSFTYVATANAVMNAGGKPVFADIERKTFGLDPEDVKEKITDKTAGIIPVHFSGDVCYKIDSLIEIARDNNLFLVEDAAHALGASKKDKNAGTFGDSAMFSLAFNKLISTGEGGILVTDSEGLNDKLRKIREQGKSGGDDIAFPGFNLMMSSMEASLGLSQLNKIDELIEKRRELANEYDRGLEDLPVQTPKRLDEHYHVFQRYNILCNDKSQRDSLIEYLSENDIPTTISYEPLHLFNFIKENFNWGKGDLTNTEDISSRIVTLPFHPNLTKEKITYITKKIENFF